MSFFKKKKLLKYLDSAEVNGEEMPWNQNIFVSTLPELCGACQDRLYNKCVQPLWASHNPVTRVGALLPAECVKSKFSKHWSTKHIFINSYVREHVRARFRDEQELKYNLGNRHIHIQFKYLLTYMYIRYTYLKCKTNKIYAKYMALRNLAVGYQVGTYILRWSESTDL